VLSYFVAVFIHFLFHSANIVFYHEISICVIEFYDQYSIEKGFIHVFDVVNSQADWVCGEVFFGEVGVHAWYSEVLEG